MRLTELLGAQVVDGEDRSLGPVRDVRLERKSDAFRVAGIVVGGGRFAGAAHGWGYAEGRAQGPWLLRRLTRDAVRRARFIRAEQVSDWGPGIVRIDASASELEPLRQ